MILIYWVEAYVSIEKNTEALVVSSKKTGLDVNADKTKYMVMSQDQNARQSHSKKSDNSSFEKVEAIKCLGTILTNQNSIFMVLCIVTLY